jgi:hypothetical protein
MGSSGRIFAGMWLVRRSRLEWAGPWSHVGMGTERPPIGMVIEFEENRAG